MPATLPCSPSRPARYLGDNPARLRHLLCALILISIDHSPPQSVSSSRRLDNRAGGASSGRAANPRVFNASVITLGHRDHSISYVATSHRKIPKMDFIIIGPQDFCALQRHIHELNCVIFQLTGVIIGEMKKIIKYSHIGSTVNGATAILRHYDLIFRNII